MTRGEWEAKLKTEGFAQVYARMDPPEMSYPPHAHSGPVARVILEGDMVLTVGGDSVTLSPGDRMDIPASVTHAARIGPYGCTYLIGE
ncbi:MAG: cupin domain-containing protein [Patescibacteria group bacterium]